MSSKKRQKAKIFKRGAPGGGGGGGRKTGKKRSGYKGNVRKHKALYV